MARRSQIETARIEEALSNAWLRIPYEEKDLFNPLQTLPPEYYDEPHMYILSLLSQPDYFAVFAKEIMNITLLPFQCAILEELWTRKFPMLIGSRGLGKSYLLGLYALLRMIFMPGRKIVITGAGYRQSKIIFEYIEKFWYGAPLLRDMVGTHAPNGAHKNPDMWRFIIGESTAIALPVGNGEKIRGQRAHDILVDEFAVGNEQIFEHVISGFAAVSANVVHNVQDIAKRKLAKELNYHLDEPEDDGYRANQIVLTGTAYYSFNHFYKYWRQWQNIIKSRGDKRKLIESGINDTDIDWRNYSVMRIPYECIPEGFMEKAIVARSKSTMHSSLYMMEFSACFGTDSNGFFKRLMIERCVSDHKPLIEGEQDKTYILAVDPASEHDNFCIVILEVSKNVRRIVNCWTTKRTAFKAEKRAGISKEEDFYDYAARKILDYINKFNIVGIAVDTQGGGRTIIERLHSSNVVKTADGENLIWEIIDPEEVKEEDGEPGLHIIEGIQFANSEWNSAANHGLRLDLETRALLFPKFDNLTFAQFDLSIENGVASAGELDEITREIEGMKDELSSIVMTVTPAGREHWDTPEQKSAGIKKGSMRKDRYSALLMANALAKKYIQAKPGPSYDYSGGFARFSPITDKEVPNAPMYSGNTILAKKLNDLYRDI